MQSSICLDTEQWLRRLRERSVDRPYLAMYSSYVDGIVADPALMIVPADDHLVHRGDGVFETLKCITGALYNFDAHIDRLENSAAVIGVSLPFSRAELLERIVAVVRAGGAREVLIKVLVSRGPGSLGVSPSESVGAQVYIMAAPLPPPFMARHPAGASAVTVDVPLKPSFLAKVKTCNYIPNALMARAAELAGADFPVAFDEDDCLAEGAVESVAVVTGDRRLVVPPPDRVLAGTTLQRVIELVRRAPGSPPVRVETEALPRSVVSRAAELLVTGTTRNVTAVVTYDGRPVGNGRPGPVYSLLAALLEEDMYRNPAVRKPVFE